MSAIDGLSHEEVAGRLDTTVETTRSLLARARENLRRTAAARETACDAVCMALDEAAVAGVRASEVARRHLWSCSDCRAYQRDLRTTPVAPAPAGELEPVGRRRAAAGRRRARGRAEGRRRRVLRARGRRRRGRRAGAGRPCAPRAAARRGHAARSRSRRRRADLRKRPAAPRRRVRHRRSPHAAVNVRVALRRRRRRSRSRDGQAAAHATVASTPIARVSRDGERQRVLASCAPSCSSQPDRGRAGRDAKAAASKYCTPSRPAARRRAARALAGAEAAISKTPRSRSPPAPPEGRSSTPGADAATPRRPRRRRRTPTPTPVATPVATADRDRDADRRAGRDGDPDADGVAGTDAPVAAAG